MRASAERARGARSPTRAAAGEIPEAEAPDLEAKLEGLQKPRGWGLFLIQNMVDDVRDLERREHITPSSSSCSWKEGTNEHDSVRSRGAARGRRRRDRALRRHRARRPRRACTPPTQRWPREPVVVLDFAAVDYINSTGIALIVGHPRRGPQERTGGPRPRPRRALPGDLPHHAALGLHDHPRRGGKRNDPGHCGDGGARSPATSWA